MEPSDPSRPLPHTRRLRATPLARRLAEEHGIDVAQIARSPGRAVFADDVLATVMLQRGARPARYWGRARIQASDMDVTRIPAAQEHGILARVIAAIATCAAEFCNTSGEFSVGPVRAVWYADGTEHCVVLHEPRELNFEGIRHRLQAISEGAADWPGETDQAGFVVINLGELGVDSESVQDLGRHYGILTIGAPSERAVPVTSTGSLALAIRRVCRLTLSYDTTRVCPQDAARLLAGLRSALQG